MVFYKKKVKITQNRAKTYLSLKYIIQDIFVQVAIILREELFQINNRYIKDRYQMLNIAKILHVEL